MGEMGCGGGGEVGKGTWGALSETECCIVQNKKDKFGVCEKVTMEQRLCECEKVRWAVVILSLFVHIKA
jgi:hypothetical protein